MRHDGMIWTARDARWPLSPRIPDWKRWLVHRLMVLRGGIGPLTLGGRAPLPWYLADGGSVADCVAAYQFKGMGSYALAKVNQAHPGTNDAVDGAAFPTWASATGVTFNGSTQYLKTGIVPPNTQSWSVIVRFASASAGYLAIYGAYIGASTFLIEPNCPGNLTLYSSGGYIQISPAMVSGVLSVCGNRAYRNGVVESGTIPTQAGSLCEIYIGCANNNGAPSLFNGHNSYAMAIYSVTKSGAAIAALSTAMSNL